MFPFEVLLDICKFLRRIDLFRAQLSGWYFRQLVEGNELYWPLNRCYRFTFLEYFARNTLGRAQNLDEDFPISLPAKISNRLAALPHPMFNEDDPIPVFVDTTEPIFLVFEFGNGRKFYVQFEPQLNEQNVDKVLFWLHQMSTVYFEEEIRGMVKFAPRFLQWLDALRIGHVLRFQCKTLGCYEYEPFEPLDVQFALAHLRVDRLDKANGTIFSPALLQLLHEGGACVRSFSTRWVMNCGPSFTDDLIQHAMSTKEPYKMIGQIRFTPAFHRQRELPIPRRTLQPSDQVTLIRLEESDWRFEEWEVRNVQQKEKIVCFRVSIWFYRDPVVFGEDGEAISQLNIDRMPDE